MRARVVLIHNFLAPFRTPLFEELARRFDFEVWILGDVRVIREWDLRPADMPFPCRRLPGMTIPLGSRYNALLFNHTLPAALVRSNADVVMCCGWDSPAAFYCGLWARFSRRPFILWSGSTPAEDSRLRRWTAPAVRWLVRSADGYVADGSRAADYLVSLGAARERVTPAYNAVDNEFYAEHSRLSEAERNAVRAELGIGDGPVCLYVGNLLALKGVFELVDAFAQFAQRQPNAWLVMVGDGADAAAVRTRCETLGIDARVRFTGFAGPEFIARCMGIADLFVLASRQEIWGMVINEALACGVPILATDVCGAVADLVEDGVNGLVVPSRNPDALAGAMQRYFAAPESHDAMRAAARRSIAPFTVAAAATAFEHAVAAARPAD